MKSVRIKTNAIVNVSGHGEKGQGDYLRNISDELAAHLVDQARVAEYVQQSAEEKSVHKKPRKPPSQQFEEAEASINHPAAIDSGEDSTQG